MASPIPNIEAPDSLSPVSLARRLGAIIYDALLLLALWLVVALIFLGISSQTQLHLIPIQFVTNLIVAWGFFAWFWTHGGQTLGMQTWTLRLVTDSGHPVGLWSATLRYLVALAQWLLILLGVHLTREHGAGASIAVTAVLVLALGLSQLHPSRLMLHDWLSGTQLHRIPAQRTKRPEPTS